MHFIRTMLTGDQTVEHEGWVPEQRGGHGARIELIGGKTLNTDSPARPCRYRMLGIVAAGLLLAACGNPVGTPCQISGSGFTASHDCKTKCLSRWNVVCPSGDNVLPNVCAGKSDCGPGQCPDGQLCYHFDDPFDERSYCVPDTVCGSALVGDAASAWEIAADERAAASRAKSAERKQRREQAIRDGQPAVAPDAQPLSEDQE